MKKIKILITLLLFFTAVQASLAQNTAQVTPNFRVITPFQDPLDSVLFSFTGKSDGYSTFYTGHYLKDNFKLKSDSTGNSGYVTQYNLAKAFLTGITYQKIDSVLTSGISSYHGFGSTSSFQTSLNDWNVIVANSANVGGSLGVSSNQSYLSYKAATGIRSYLGINIGGMKVIDSLYFTGLQLPDTTYEANFTNNTYVTKHWVLKQIPTGGSFIQNQNASAQVANGWIQGTFKVSGTSISGHGGATFIGPGLLTLEDTTASTAIAMGYSPLNNDMEFAQINSGFIQNFSFGVPTQNNRLVLPNKSGTIATTADIPTVTGYVLYSGGNNNLNLVPYNISATDFIGSNVTITSPTIAPTTAIYGTSAVSPLVINFGAGGETTNSNVGSNGGLGAQLYWIAGQGGESDNGVGGIGGQVEFDAGNGGVGGTTGGSGGDFTGRAGDGGFGANSNGGNAALKGGWASGSSIGNGGNIYLSPGAKGITGLDGTTYLDVSNSSVVRGNVVVGNNVDDRVHVFQVTGNSSFTGSIDLISSNGFSGTLSNSTLTSNQVYALPNITGTVALLNSFSASTPLSYNNTTATFNIAQSNTSTDGYLSHTDWSTFNGKQNSLTFDSTPTSGSTNPVTSGGIFTALSGKQTNLIFSTGLNNSGGTVTIDQSFSPTWSGTHIFSSPIIANGGVSSNTLKSISGSSLSLSSAGLGNSIIFLQSTTEDARFAPSTGNLLVGTTTEGGYKLDIQSIGTNGYFRAGTGLIVNANGLVSSGANTFGTLSQLGSIVGVASTQSTITAGSTIGKIFAVYSGITTRTTDAGTIGLVTATSSFGIPTYATSSAATYTNAATVYIDGAPAAGNNVAIANPFSLYVNSGATYFGGTIIGNSTLVLNGYLSTASNAANANLFVGSASAISNTLVSGVQFLGGSTVNYRTFFYGTTSSTIGSGNNYGSVILGSTPLTTATSGTHALLANEVINPLGTITNGSASVTNTASLFVNGNASATVTGLNYGLWATGNTRVDLGSDAIGDILYRGSNNALARLPIGSSGQILAISSGTPAWQNGTNYLNGRTTVVDVNYSQSSTDYLIAYTTLSASRTVALTAINDKQTVVIKDESGNAATDNIVIDAPAGKYIDGVSSKTINTNMGSLKLYYQASSGNYFTY